MDLVDTYFEMNRAEAEILAILTYEGDRPVTENPEDFEMFTYYVQIMDDDGVVETPSDEEGDWIDFQSYSINGSREVLGFVPVRTDSAQRLRGYEEGIRDGSEPSYFTADIYPNVYE